MPQLFQVLRCYQCEVFQVHQCKKNSKFECKLCGEKQSIKKRYCFGTAKECRHHVQKLNVIRGEKDEENLNNYLDTSGSDEEIENKDSNKSNFDNTRPIKSKWSKFVDENNEDTPDKAPNETIYLNNTEAVIEVPKKRIKGKFNAPSKGFVTPTVSNKLDRESLFSEDTILMNKGSSFNTLNANMISNPKLLNGFKKNSNSEIASQNTSSNSAQPKKESKKFVPPPPSKWSQFIEPSTSNTIVQHPQELFALCNDEDLDNVLFMY